MLLNNIDYQYIEYLLSLFKRTVNRYRLFIQPISSLNRNSSSVKLTMMFSSLTGSPHNTMIIVNLIMITTRVHFSKFQKFSSVKITLQPLSAVQMKKTVCLMLNQLCWKSVVPTVCTKLACDSTSRHEASLLARRDLASLLFCT